MCRLLLIKSDRKFEIKPYLEKFAIICKKSKEYQGHGWGVAYLENKNWKVNKKINPIWEDNFLGFKKTNYMLVHARSAFQDKDIIIENNMPFYDGNYVFIFNGEIRGVKINEKGRIGAEKMFNYIKRFAKKNQMLIAIKKATLVIEKKSKYIRAMNFIIADKENAYYYSKFNEDIDYFTMNMKKEKNKIILSSEILDKYCSCKINNKSNNWNIIHNESFGAL